MSRRLRDVSRAVAGIGFVILPVLVLTGCSTESSEDPVTDPQELFSEAADIAAELGLESNANNGDGAGEGEEHAPLSYLAG